MHSAIETLEKLLTQAKETWEDEAFQQRLKNLRERLALAVRKNPASSMGLALLAGFLIGKIKKREKTE